MKLSPVGLALALLLLLPGCAAVRHTPAATASAPPPLDRHTYTNGFVRFVDSDTVGVGRESYWLRGKMEVTVWDNYIKVDQGGDAVFYLPHNRVVYVGHEIPTREGEAADPPLAPAPKP